MPRNLALLRKRKTNKTNKNVGRRTTPSTTAGRARCTRRSSNRYAIKYAIAVKGPGGEEREPLSFSDSSRGVFFLYLGFLSYSLCVVPH